MGARPKITCVMCLERTNSATVSATLRPLQTNNFCAEIFGELQIRGQSALIRFLGADLAIDVDDVEFGVHAARHAGATRDQILAGGICGNADGHAFADAPVLADVLGLHVGFEAAIDLLGDLAEGEFAECDQVAAAEEILQRALDFFGGVDIAALHAVLQGFGSEVDHHGFGGRERHPIRDGFAHDDAGDGADHRREALDVLDVERRDHVDFGGENFLDVFVALAVFAAGDVGVGEFVDQDDFGMSRDDGVDVHFLEHRAFVLELFAWNGFELAEELFDAFAAVRFDDADDDVLAAAAAANGFAEHAEGLADAWRVAQEKLEDAAGFLRAARRLRASPQASWARLVCSVVASCMRSNVTLQHADRIGACSDSWPAARWVWRSARRDRRRHYLPVSQRPARQPDNRCAVVSAGNFSSFSGLGNGRFGVHVRWRRCWSFNYLFLPPVGTLTIADPQNWVALFAFLVTSIMGSQLSSRIRKEADEAHQRRREVERLYRFSRKLLGEGNVIQLMNAIPDYIVESFEAGAAELFLPQKDKFYRSGFGASHLDEEKMKAAFANDEMTMNAEQGCISCRSGWECGRSRSLGISGSQLSRQSVEAVSTLGGDRDRAGAGGRATGPDRGGAAGRAAEVGAA